MHLTAISPSPARTIEAYWEKCRKYMPMTTLMISGAGNQNNRKHLDIL